MFAYFYIPRLSNDMKLAVHKNHLGGQMLYRRFEHSKKRRLSKNFEFILLDGIKIMIRILHLIRTKFDL